MLKLRAIVHVHACLANDLNPIAKLYILILYLKVAMDFFADHPDVTARPGLPLAKSSFKSIVCYSRDFTLSV